MRDRRDHLQLRASRLKAVQSVAQRPHALAYLLAFEFADYASRIGPDSPGATVGGPAGCASLVRVQGTFASCKASRSATRLLKKASSGAMA
jgi:hypothetical protein